MRFDQLDIPIAIGMPDKVIKRVCRFVKAIALNGRRCFGNGLLIFRHNPAVNWFFYRCQINGIGGIRTAIHF